MTSETEYLGMIGLSAFAAGCFIMFLYQGAPPAPAEAQAPPAAAVAQAGSPAPYEEGQARVVTNSVLGTSTAAYQPGYGASPSDDASTPLAPAPAPAYVPVPVYGGAPAGVVHDRTVILREKETRTIVEQQPQAQNTGDGGLGSYHSESVVVHFGGEPRGERQAEPRERGVGRRDEPRETPNVVAGPTIGGGRGFGGGHHGGGRVGIP